MSKRSHAKPLQAEQLTFLQVDSPAKIYRWLDSAKVWLVSGQGYGSSLYELLATIGQDGLSLKMSPVFYPVTADEILPSSFAGWQSAGISSPTGCLTLNMTEWHSGATVCSLSQVLEPQVASKYFLSAKAASGILRRAEKRGKALPQLLNQALIELAERDRLEVPLTLPQALSRSDSSEMENTQTGQQHSELKVEIVAAAVSI